MGADRGADRCARAARLSEPEGFASIVAGFARRPRVAGPVIHDARIAAICVAHGVEKLMTRDRDFSLFPELVTEDPFQCAVRARAHADRHRTDDAATVWKLLCRSI